MRTTPRTLVSLALVTMAGLFPASAAAQLCADGSNTNVGFGPPTNDPTQPPINCEGDKRCYTPELTAPAYELLPIGCDPTAESCAARGTTPVRFPGNSVNPLPPPGSRGWVTLDWTDSAGGFAGSCGVPGANILSDRGEPWVEITNFTCDSSPNSDVFTLTAEACALASCGTFRETIEIDLSLPALSALFCPPPPPKEDCTNCLCRAGGPGSGVAGIPVRDLAPEASGPGATLRYSAAGVGHPGFPGSTEWNVALGRYWSHDYAERIVEDPDETHVWLLTKTGVFREFSGLSKGVYDTVSPSDEYRTLHWLNPGWELRSADGTVQEFDAAGKWTRTEDRNDNATVAIYDASDRLSTVSFADQRSETFAYDGADRLQSITEVGVFAMESRTWTYSWTGDDLTRIDRPDNTAWVFAYDDPSHAGYITSMVLEGTDSSQRVERAWEYDAAGNVSKSWKGAPVFTDPDAVDKYQFGYDNPALPTVTTVTDPLGDDTVYTMDRDPVSDKARMVSILGNCSTCGVGPETDFVYLDPSHPLLPTNTFDGNATETQYTYGPFGRMESRTEAFGTGVERTTFWEYTDPGYPVFPTAIIQESVAGAPAERRTDLVYTPEGSVVTRTISGIEDGSAFSHVTAMTYHPVGGQLWTVDPSGFGAADVTTFLYDAARGNLILDERIDPIIGSTFFDQDDYNRRISTTDSNGLVTETDYDDLDRVEESAQRGPTAAEDLITTQEYTVFGDLFRTTLPRDNVIEYGYDSAGRLTSIERRPDATTLTDRTFFVLDGAGNSINQKLQSWNGSTWDTHNEVATEYVSRCQVQKTILAPGTANESVTERAYDCNGNLEKVWDANHDSTIDPPTQLYGYDLLDRVRTIAVPWSGAGGGNAVTQYDYDVQDHLIEVEDAEGNLTTYDYSDRDLLTQETSVAAGTTSYGYNAHGEMTSALNALGVVETRVVDAADRVTLIDFVDDSLDVGYAWGTDAGVFNNGRLIGITRDGETIAYAYDSFGRQTTDGALVYGFDKNGNAGSIEYLGGSGGGGVTATYTYDHADRQDSLTVDHGTGPQAIASNVSYLPSGPPTSVDFGNGLTEARGFDDRYFPTSIALTPTGGGPASFSWDYDLIDRMGNVLSISDTLDPSKSRTYGYQDHHYFLTCAAGPWAVGSPGNCIGALAGGAPITWTYNKIGNRLDESRDGAPSDVYSYEASGASPVLDSIALGSGVTKDYSFDAAGNLTSIADSADPQASRIYGVHQTNRMASIENATSVLGTFSYDGRGFLRAVEMPNLAVPGYGDFNYPTYSSSGVLYHQQEVSSGFAYNVRDHFVLYLAGRPVATLKKRKWSFAPPQVRYYLTDHLGAPAMVTNSNGSKVVWEGGFEPFGDDYAGAGSAGVFLRLPGQWSDSSWENGQAGAGLDFDYNVHRWYEPGTGRYGRVDPALTADTMGRYIVSAPSGLLGYGKLDFANPYLYVFSNPVAFLDPLGLACENCDACPGGRWGLDGHTLSGGFNILGLSFGGSSFRGTYTCRSNKSLEVPVKITCRFADFGLYAAIGWDGGFSLPPLGPGGCGCNPSDLYGDDELVTVGVGYGDGTIGDCSTGGKTGFVSSGVSLSAGITGLQCTTKPRIPE